MMTRDYAAPDWRGLCEELAEFVARLTKHYYEPAKLLVRARAALAQPEPEAVGPTDEELLELMPETTRDEFSYAAKTCSDVTGGQVKPGVFRVCLNTAALEYARAVLARWGRPAPVPAEGEVAELARWLRENADSAANADHHEPAELLTRAADLLEQCHPAPVPVAVSDRLPGVEDCDAEGRCWFLRFPFDYSRESWALEDRTYGCNTGFTHWLPFNALPLPSGDAIAAELEGAG